MRQTTLTGSKRTIPVSIYPTPAALGQALAGALLRQIAAAKTQVRPLVGKGGLFLLGCPGGRSLQTTYQALGEQASQTEADLSRLVIVMMDEYVFPAEHPPTGSTEHPPTGSTLGGFVYGPEEAHYSCRRFAWQEIWAALNHGLPEPRQIPAHQVWFPDPADPPAYDARLKAAGGIDLFLLASGATDGHVAFNPPGSRLAEGAHIVTLAETTRRDNLATFPEFKALAEVPHHGVSVGLGSIVELSRQVALVIHGPHKQFAVRRLAACADFTADWPASVIFRCQQAQLLLDEAAAGDLF